MFKGYFVVLSTALSNLRHQTLNYLSAVATITIVMVILVGFTAIGTSFNKIVSNTGSDQTAIILQTGANSEISSSIAKSDVLTLGTALDDAGITSNGALSQELLMVLSTKQSDGTEARVTLRGMDAEGLKYRNNLNMVTGSLFAMGSDQIALGVKAANALGITQEGQKVVLGRTTWTVSGIFSDGQSIYESEIWTSSDAMAAVYNRNTSVQSVRMQIDSADQLAQVEDLIASDPRLSFSVMTEKAYFKSSAGTVGDIIFYIGWPLALIMAVGSLTGAINTISASVAVRAHHLASMRAIGVRPGPIFWGIMSEALVQAVIGAIIGGTIAWFLLSGFEVSTVGEGFSKISFSLEVDDFTILNGFILCTGIGLLSGFIPALKISRGNLARLLNAG